MCVLKVETAATRDTNWRTEIGTGRERTIDTRPREGCFVCLCCLFVLTAKCSAQQPGYGMSFLLLYLSSLDCLLFRLFAVGSYAMDAMAMALHCLYHTVSAKEALLRIANL
jgi:hypothetical protein